MGRGTLDTGLLRAEQHDWQVRTTDPAGTQEGDAWVRSDVAPETDQIATLRFDRGASTVDIPIFDSAASVTDVEKVWRVRVGGVTGFIPLAASGETGAYEFLKFQHAGNALDTHDALDVITIPDSGVARYEFEQDVTDSWGANDATDQTSAGYVTGKYGSYAKDFDNTDDYVDTNFIPPREFSISTWIKPTNFDNIESIYGSSAGTNEVFVRIRGDKSGNDMVAYLYDGSTTYGFKSSDGSAPTNVISSGTWNHIVFVAFDNDFRIYVDAVEENSNSQSGHPTISNSPWLGARDDGGSGTSFFGGAIDQTDWYNKSLSSTEVSNLYNTGSISG